MKSQSSVSSKKSGSNYRKVSDRSQVDETLFGGKAKAQGGSRGSVADSEVRALKTKVQGGSVPENVAVIPLSEMQRMKASAVLKSKEQALAEQQVLEEQKEQQRAAAKARKERMQQLEQERQKNAPLNEADREHLEKQQHFRERAKALLEKEHDDVKQMNQKVLYAKVVTVRDEQLIEKKSITEDKKKEEERLDLLMEIERLKVIKYHDEREQSWKEDRKRGALVLEDQIREREHQRMKEQELLEKERQQMLKQIEVMQQEEHQQALEKKVMQQKLLAEVDDANRKALVAKEEKKRQERVENDKIVQYNIERAKKEQETLEEQERIKAEKEREVQLLRERQEKAKDRQSELDALRAKRAQEAQERAERDKERREAEKRANINRELEDARVTQAREKEIRMMIQVKQERDEFERIIQVQKEEAEAEKRLEAAKAQLRRQHAEQLKAQILTNSEKKMQEQREYLEEGRKLRKEIDEERQHLESIKQDKLQKLIHEGIPDQYTTELARKKINI